MTVMMILLVLNASAYTVSGTVTGSGVGVLENASVEAYNFTNGVLIGSDTTDASGNYNLTVPSTPAAYVFNASATGFNEASKTVFVNDNKTVDFILGPQQSVNITGIVYNTAGGVISNADVKADYMGSTVDSTTTDGSGAYTLTVIDSTSYDVTASKAGFISDTQQVITSGSVVQNFNLTPAPTDGTVQGYVLNSTGGALPGATVRLMQSGGMVDSDTTAGDGLYSITEAGGTYDLEASLTGYNTDSETGFAITNGQTKNLNFTLTKAGSCVENWTCTSWSSCSGGVQTRTCTDQNSCGTELNKPAESQSCSNGGGNNYHGTVYSIELKDDGTVKRVRGKDIVKFNFKNEEHSVTVSKISSDTVSLLIESDPIAASLNEGQTGKYDLDSDGFFDLKIIVDDISASKATLDFRLINEAVNPQPRAQTTTTTTRTTTPPRIIPKKEVIVEDADDKSEEDKEEKVSVFAASFAAALEAINKIKSIPYISYAAAGIIILLIAAVLVKLFKAEEVQEDLGSYSKEQLRKRVFRLEKQISRLKTKLSD